MGAAVLSVLLATHALASQNGIERLLAEIPTELQNGTGYPFKQPYSVPSGCPTPNQKTVFSVDH